MSSTSENETEILLGNRHLLAIFFVLAVLLGIAFTGGYMVGRNSSDKKTASLAATVADPAASTSTGAETHALAPAGDATDQAAANNPPPAEEKTHTVQPPPELAPAPAAHEDAPLGSPRNNQSQQAEETATPPAKAPPAPILGRVKNDSFSGPQSGQTYLQVAAVGHTEAKALADVLSKKGFHAHAVAKPGASDIYRVLVGPMQDTGELSSTRDSLRNAGFTKIFVQRY